MVVLVTLYPVENLVHRVEAHIVCKTLIEPEIVPPFHCDEVAKPAMCDLVQHCFGKVDHHLLVLLFFENVLAIEYQQTWILHG